MKAIEMAEEMAVIWHRYENQRNENRGGGETVASGVSGKTIKACSDNGNGAALFSRAARQQRNNVGGSETRAALIAAHRASRGGAKTGSKRTYGA
jgi:hypothetical protein